MIQQQQIQGCDKYSKIYCDSYNILEQFIVTNAHEDKDGNFHFDLNNIGDFDRSSLGLYIGKFVEQEINSSIVQLMREYCGIEMPRYYNKRDPNFHDDDTIETWNGNKVSLNKKVRGHESTKLQTIPLGDAFYALESLKRENPDFFHEYEWIYDVRFLELWRNLMRFRNKVAHIGEIISNDELQKALDCFLKFLRYMPHITKLKESLFPQCNMNEEMTVANELKNKYSNKPQPSTNQIDRYYYLIENGRSRTTQEDEELKDLRTNYCWHTVIFENKEGKKGMKDLKGNILIPARYDDIAFTFDDDRETVPATKHGKMGLVKTDGNGTEITKFVYDRIECINMNISEGYAYKKDDSISFGILLEDGTEALPCVIDEFMYMFSLSLYYRSGDYYGIWCVYNHDKPTLPIYDDIDIQYDSIGTPQNTLFTLKGSNGFVKCEGNEFIPLENFYKMDEWDRPSCLIDA